MPLSRSSVPALLQLQRIMIPASRSRCYWLVGVAVLPLQRYICWPGPLREESDRTRRLQVGQGSRCILHLGHARCAAMLCAKKLKEGGTRCVFIYTLPLPTKRHGGYLILVFVIVLLCSFFASP